MIRVFVGLLLFVLTASSSSAQDTSVDDLKIHMAQVYFRPGDFDHALRELEKAMKTAVEQRADIVVLPVGFAAYPLNDNLYKRDLVARLGQVDKQIQRLSAKYDVTLIIGQILKNP